MARTFKAEAVPRDFLGGFKRGDYDPKGQAFRIMAEPEETRHADGSSSISLGFPLLLLSAYCGEAEAVAERVAEVLTKHFFVERSWLPVDAAPRDGTVVDLWRDGERLTDYRWCPKRNTWITERGFPVVTVALVTQPTHFMLAPKPPVEERAS